MNAGIQENARKKPLTWHGPKQVGVMLYTAVLMLIAACIVGGSTNTVMPALAQLRGWDVNILMVWAGIGCMLVAPGNLVFSSAMRVLRPKLTNGLTLLASAVLLVVFGVTTNLTLFLVVVCLLGFLSAGYQLAGNMTLTANWWPTKKGIVLGWTTMGVVLMGVLYVPYIPAAYARFGIAGTHIGIAVIVAIIGIIGLIFVKDTPEEAGTFPDGDDTNPEDITAVAKAIRAYKSPFTFAKVARQSSTWTISIGLGLCFIAAMSFVGSQIPVLMSYGYNYPFAAFIFAVGGVVALPGSWAFGLLDQKIGTKKACIWYTVILFVAFVFALLMKSSLVCIWIATVILFACQGGLCNLIPSYVGTKYGRWDYAAAYRIIGTIPQLGAGFGFTVIGLFASFTSMYIFDLIIIAVAFVLMLVTDDKFIGKAG